MRKYYYSNKGFREVDGPDGAWWVNVMTPDTDDTRYLIEEEGIPPILLDYLEDKDERPRIERNGDWLMIIVRIPIANDTPSMPYTTVPMGIISRNSDRVFTVCYHQNLLTEDFASHTCHYNIDIHTASEFTLRIFFAAAHWYLTYLKSMSDYVIGNESVLEKSIANEDLKQLMRLQKSLVYFNTSIKGDVMVLTRIQKIFEAELDQDLEEDVDIELNQADTTVGIYSDILKATMDSYASIISNNANEVMKRMSGLSIILIVPTFVASLYGMNVDILLSSHYSFWIIIGIATALTTLAFVCLRRLKWV